jgi:hypothetical protein
MFFSLVLFAVSLAVSVAIDEGAVILFPCALFFISLVWILYARLFIPKTPSVSPPVFQPAVAQRGSFGSYPEHGSLNPAASVSIAPIGREQIRTNELSQPTSVTENTTRLLDD